MNEPVSTPTPPKKSRWPSYKAGVVERWIGEALTQFLNGFIRGWKHAAVVGGGTGALTGLNPEIAMTMTAWNQILISVGSVVFTMTASGLNQVIDWHANNPVPNPWGKYDPNAAETRSPFSPTPQ